MMLLPQPLIDLATRVIEGHRAAGTRIVVAESCTGGLVAAALTEVSGASDVFDGAWVTYSNQAKVTELGVSNEVLDTFGAVSIAAAWAMARGALVNSTADLAVSITGIAGPNGATPGKPVGTVVFARAMRGGDPTDIITDSRYFAEEDRSGVRLQAALCALELLLPLP